MACFVVSYDLRAPRRDYETLYKRLADWKAVKVLESVWLINWNSDAPTVKADLAKHIDANDGLFVARLTGDADWQKLLVADQLARAVVSS